MVGGLLAFAFTASRAGRAVGSGKATFAVSRG